MRNLLILCLLIVLVGLLVVLGVIGLTILVGLIIASPFLALHYLRHHQIRSTLGWTALMVTVLAIIGIGIWWGVKGFPLPTFRNEITKNAKTMTGQIVKTTPVTAREITKYRWYWELPEGQYVNGRNRAEPDDGTLELVSDGDPNSLCFDLHYIQNGRPQTCRLRLKRIRNGAWSGTFNQNYPEDHGWVELREIDDKDCYSGTLRWENQKVALFWVSKT